MHVCTLAFLFLPFSLFQRRCSFCIRNVMRYNLEEDCASSCIYHTLWIQALLTEPMSCHFSTSIILFPLYALVLCIYYTLCWPQKERRYNDNKIQTEVLTAYWSLYICKCITQLHRKNLNCTFIISNIL